MVHLWDKSPHLWTFLLKKKIITSKFGYDLIQKKEKNSIVKSSGKKHNEARSRGAWGLYLKGPGKRCPTVCIWIRLMALFGLQKDLVHGIRGAPLWFAKKSWRYAFFPSQKKRANWQDRVGTGGSRMGMRLHLTSTFHVPSGSLAFALPTSLSKRGLKIKSTNASQIIGKRIIWCLFFQNYRKNIEIGCILIPTWTLVYYVAVQK